MFCLDTNVVIFAMNKRRPEIARRLDEELALGRPLMVSSIVLCELRYGVAKSNRRERSQVELDAFLAAGFQIPAFDAEDAAEAGEIRAFLQAKATPIGPYDVLIAAQARRRGAALVTLNRREFERVPGLTVTDWAM
jgi:tRNA(fMet)-specific endonuclease VapC